MLPICSRVIRLISQGLGPQHRWRGQALQDPQHGQRWILHHSQDLFCLTEGARPASLTCVHQLVRNHYFCLACRGLRRNHISPFLSLPQARQTACAQGWWSRASQGRRRSPGGRTNGRFPESPWSCYVGLERDSSEKSGWVSDWKKDKCLRGLRKFGKEVREHGAGIHTIIWKNILYWEVFVKNHMRHQGR